MQPTDHYLDDSLLYHRWDNATPARLAMTSGETVTIKMADATGNQVTPGMSAEAFAKIDFEKIHSLHGPIALPCLKPGDTLRVEVLEYQHHGYAWTSIIPRKGLLDEDFERFYLHHWTLEDGLTRSMPGLALHLHPFCGVMGVQREEPGAFRTRPPGAFGGNMDVRHLTAGSTLFLPVQVEQGMLCCGDAHAAQGDGEVSINGMEAPMTVSLRLSKSDTVKVDAPYLQTTPDLLPPAYAGKPFHAFIESGPDLRACAQGAVRRAIDYLMQRLGHSAEQAYVTCSVVLDLRGRPSRSARSRPAFACLAGSPGQFRPRAAAFHCRRWRAP